MLFPLGSVLMPEGKMKLRIFEPRYQRMVAQASKTDTGFGICLYDSSADKKSNPLSHFGTWVKIVDFETLGDGLLGITVVGAKRFKIRSVRSEFDGLRMAKIDLLPSWPVRHMDENEAFLAHRLQKVYRDFPQLGELYTHCFYDDASWVTQRWLELMPLVNQQFDQISQNNDCDKALSYLLNAIESFGDGE